VEIDINNFSQKTPVHQKDHYTYLGEEISFVAYHSHFCSAVHIILVRPKMELSSILRIRVMHTYLFRKKFLGGAECSVTDLMNMARIDGSGTI